ncbi:MAG: peptidoglycan DD-metalloendopeptidase family protein [Actinomycetota bacterium]|nr:peptidoglycan DD-metalloendopeptidase family protein [Actinomycetota bacterium]
MIEPAAPETERIMAPRAPLIGLVVTLACALCAAPAQASHGRAGVAALQVALRAAGVYSGGVDGVRGPGTIGGVKAIQRRAGLTVDGIAGRRTRRALGRRGRPRYGSRAMRAGHAGWDVAALQFKLGAHGFPSGPVDGGLGPRSSGALRRFQARAGLGSDGIVGPATLRALRTAPPRSPVKLFRPVRAPIGDRFGPRGVGFHAGLDFPAPSGTRVTAAGFGTVLSVGYSPGGWGNFVIVRHRFGLRTLYAHLSSISVGRGRFVPAGGRIGRVGATGSATGPHLHWEILLRGANVDPLSAL